MPQLFSFGHQIRFVLSLINSFSVRTTYRPEAKKQRELAELEKDITLFAVDAAVWQKARKLASRCRDSGLTSPSADIVIAACARHYGLTLEHCDAHFDKILPVAKKL